jgi:hypothetical protein
MACYMHLVVTPNPSLKRSANGRLPGPGLAPCRRRPLSSNYKGFPTFVPQRP